MKNKVIFALVLVLFFAACKYEDGPIISLRSKHNRLNGGWKFKEVLVDGIDSTEAYQQQFPIINFISNQELWSAYLKDVIMRYYTEEPASMSTPVIWCYGEFNKKKTYLEVCFADSIPLQHHLGLIGSAGIQEWEVLKLSNVNLWFKINTNNRVYFLKLKSTNKKF